MTHYDACLFLPLHVPIMVVWAKEKNKEKKINKRTTKRKAQPYAPWYPMICSRDRCLYSSFEMPSIDTCTVVSLSRWIVTVR